MLGSIAAWLVAKNLAGSMTSARGAARTILVLAGVVFAAIALVFTVWLIRWDAVQDFAAGQRGERTAEALKGERRANQGEAERALAREAASETTEAQLETIHAEDPEAAAAPASRGSRTVADRLRDR